MDVGHIKKRRRTPAEYRLADGLSELFILFLVIFGPWAFGTTQNWAIWVANATGYLLGGLLLIKWFLRWRTGCLPARWDGPDDLTQPDFKEPNEQTRARTRFLASPVFWMGVLTLAVLGYCLVSAINARATYHPPRRFLEYHQAFKWLPHSYDSGPTWQIFWQYLGLAMAFWAIRDWLLGLSPNEVQLQALEQRSQSSEQNADPHQASGRGRHRNTLVPARLHRLLLVLCLNGTLMAGEGIVQRLSGTDKLLWLKRPRYEDNLGQFGPYAYRSNAIQYLNLIWPISAGYAWILARQATRARRNGVRPQSQAHYWLPIGAILIASCSVIAGSRAGAFVAALQIVFLGFVLLTSARHLRWKLKLGLLALLALAVQVTVYLGWDYLSPRLKGSLLEQYQVRQQTVLENTQQMARDFPVFGTGPGTFAWLYQFYFEPGDFWLSHVHNDWLETRITFGWVGSSLVLLCLLPVGLHWFLGRGFPMPGVLAASISIALAGCLFAAWIDFPLQIPSILSLFLILCCVLTSGRKIASQPQSILLSE